MFCKICFDTCQVNFNNHNVKDSAGNVVCPVLLNTKCLKCGNYGHTFKFCKESVVVKSVKFVPACKTISKSGNSAPVSVGLNRFAMLCDDVLELDLDLEFDLDDIVWGVGLKYMMGKSWADVCGV